MHDPTSPQGLELLGHELTHVKQQAQGRVPVNAQVGGAPANDDPELEHEADEMGAKVARGEPVHGPAGAKAAETPAVPAGHGLFRRSRPPRHPIPFSGGLVEIHFAAGS